MLRLLLLSTIFLLLQLPSIKAQVLGEQTIGTVSFSTEVANDTQVTGLVNSPTSSSISFKFVKNSITLEEEIFVVPLLSDNTFSFSFKLEEPTPITASYEGREAKLYLEPGDDLKLQFEGNKFPVSLKFFGKGSHHNDYFFASQQQFADWNADFIHFEISRLKAQEFKLFMNRLKQQKWDFFQNFDLGKKLNFSEQFTIYAHANIDYWWAYNLIKYRIERPILTGKPVPMTLSNDYYSFLNELLINNDKALTNPHYQAFLEEYVSLIKDNALPRNNVSENEIYYFVETSTALLLAKPDEMPPLAEPKQGDRLKYLQEHSDFKSKVNVKGVESEDYWYKVQTKDGIEGWVLGIGIKKLETNIETNTNTFNPSDSKMERYIVTKMDNLKVRETPFDDKNIVATLSRNTELTYLLNKTTEYFKYPHQGISYIDYFYKIKTADGKIGWIPKMSFEFKEREVTNEFVAKGGSIATSSTSDLDAYFEDKTLFYAKAKELYWKTLHQDIAQVGREIAKFRDINPYDTYTKVLSAAYEIAQLRGKGDAEFVKNYAYSNIKTPVIKGQNLSRTYQKNKTVNRPSPSLAINPSDYVEIDAKPKARPTTPTRISGKVELPTQYPVELVLFTDPILFQEKRFELNRDFLFNINLSEPLMGKIEYGTESIPVYLEPGDRIEIFAKGTSLFKSLSFKGKGSLHNEYLFEAQKNFEPIEREMETKIRHAKASEFKDFMLTSLKKKHSFREKYHKKSSLTSDFKTLMQADIDYWYGFHMLNYTIEHPLYHGENERIDVDPRYYNFLNSLELSPEGVLPNENYTYFLNEYLAFQAEKEEHEGMTITEIAKQFLQKEAQYYIVAKELSIACKRGKSLDLGPAIKRFIDTCPYEVYNDVLRFVYNEAKGLIVGTRAPDFSLKNMEGQEVSMSDYKGKVVYLDFWATWCNPCVRALNHSQKLGETFAGQDVVFLYISLDENKKEWENFLASNDLTGVHLHEDNGNIYQSEIARLYKVKKLPTYILIDKNGKIAYNPAKNPGNSQLIAQINELLSRRKNHK